MRNLRRTCELIYERGENRTYETESESNISSDEENDEFLSASDDNITDDEHGENN